MEIRKYENFRPEEIKKLYRSVGLLSNRGVAAVLMPGKKTRCLPA